MQVAVHGLQDPYTNQDRALWHPLEPRCATIYGPRAIGYAPDLSAALVAEKADVSHAAGLWMYPSMANGSWSRRTERPYVISPHGMLDPWAIHHSAWKKRLAARLFERRHLESAACLHALCRAEAESIRAYGLTNPICVLPNGIDLPSASDHATLPVWADRFPKNRHVLLFLGRLHRKKGLVPLLQAWGLARPTGWQLVIAGWDQGGHQHDLEAIVTAQQLGDSVCFCGPLHGPDKAAAYRAADAFILPSFSEGLPMTILEAWAYGKPVLMTAACNLPEGFSAEAAVEVTVAPAALAQSLSRFFALSEGDRALIGQRGRQLVDQQFNWATISLKMISVYQWVAKQGDRPDCVLP